MTTLSAPPARAKPDALDELSDFFERMGDEHERREMHAVAWVDTQLGTAYRAVEKIVTTRGAHACHRCDRPIPSGSRSWSVSVQRGRGRGGSWWTCEECRPTGEKPMSVETVAPVATRHIGLVRVSTDAQELDRQVIAVNDWAKKQGIDGIDIRREKESGRAKVRPVLDQILAECRAGEVKCLVVSESSRLSRSLARTIELLEEFQRLNVRVVILSLGMDFDPHSTTGKFLIRQLALVSELLLDLTRDATIQALDGDVIDGKRHSIYGAKLGRPRVLLSPETLAEARARIKAGELAEDVAPTLVGTLNGVECVVSVSALRRRLRGV